MNGYMGNEMDQHIQHWSIPEAPNNKNFKERKKKEK